MAAGKVTWTKDAGGNYVDWMKPPHRVGSIVMFRLEHEEFLTMRDFKKRVAEYYKLVKREGRRGSAHQPGLI